MFYYMNLLSRLSVAGPSDLSDVVFRIVDQSMYAEVLDLLYTNFHTDEPMSRALRIFDGENRIPEADEYTLKALRENLSVMAMDSITNKLLGVSVNGIVKKSSFPASIDEVNGIQNPGFRHILLVMSNAHSMAGDLWSKVNIKYFSSKFLNCFPSYQTASIEVFFLEFNALSG